MITVKDKMRWMFVWFGIGVTCFITLGFLFDMIPEQSKYTLVILGLFFINFGFIWIVGIRHIALNWLLVKKDPEFAKLLEMDFEELKKNYKKIRKELKEGEKT